MSKNSNHKEVNLPSQAHQALIQVRNFQLEEEKEEWTFPHQPIQQQDEDRPQFHANDFLTMLSTIEFKPEN